jgi:hypothetical protein
MNTKTNNFRPVRCARTKICSSVVKSCEGYRAQIYPQSGVSETEQTNLDHHPTTTIVDDTTVSSSGYSNAPSDNMTEKFQTIKDFLAKPINVSNYSWIDTNVSSLVIDFGEIAPIIVGASIWADKIAGFALMRATVVIRVMINANPFQQGRLLLHFLPNANDFTVGNDATYVAMHNANLTTKTQQPNVEIDCRQTSGILSMPYVAPTHYADLVNNQYDWGTYYVSVLSPLTTGATPTSVECATWIHLEDVELAAPINPQSGMKASSKFKTRAVSRSEPSTVDTMGVSQGMALVQHAAPLMQVPRLSTFLANAAWATRLIAGAISVFGYSKTCTDAASLPVSRQYDRYAATSDGNDSAFPLGMLHDRSLTQCFSNSIRDVDEMSLKFLTSVDAYIINNTWVGGSGPWTPLWNFVIAPYNIFSAGFTTHMSTTADWVTGPPIFYLSQGFAFYRGSIVVTIKFIKTEFHSGRLVFVFLPTTDPTPTFANAASSSYCMREVVDIRAGNEVTLTCPYLVPYNYLTNQQCIGTLSCFVLNSLIGPPTVASNIQMLTYVKGGSDFEFMGPYNLNSIGPVFTPQSGLTLVDENIGGSIVPGVSIVPATECGGEIVSSIKQFLNRYTEIFFKVSIPVSVGGDAMSIYPWYHGVTQLLTGGTFSIPNAGGDAYDYLAPMYVSYRGGARLKVVPGTPVAGGAQGTYAATITNRNYGSGNFIVTSALVPVASRSLQDWQAPGQSTNWAGVAIMDQNVGMISIDVPYYCQTKTSLSLSSAGDGVVVDASSPQVRAVLTSSGSEWASYSLYRAFTDDFQFNYFIGCPPLLINPRI